jgi:hypothetical protein
MGILTYNRLTGVGKSKADFLPLVWQEHARRPEGRKKNTIRHHIQHLLCPLLNRFVSRREELKRFQLMFLLNVGASYERECSACKCTNESDYDSSHREFIPVWNIIDVIVSIGC